MKNQNQVAQWFRNELKGIITKNLIFCNEHGEYELFGKYKIIQKQHSYTVFVLDSEIGIFNSIRTALSWCIADKYNQYTLAQDLLQIDNRLHYLKNDISIRVAIAERSRKADFRSGIACKIETKVIRRKELEIQLTKCVNSAKYFQQRGFTNETARINRTK